MQRTDSRPETELREPVSVPVAGREVVIIVAVGPNMVIGDDKRLPWSLPRDMRLFRRLTLNHAVIMGRKTFESLNCRPLPKRRNIVVSRNCSYVARGCEVAHSLEEAIAMTPAGSRVFVIGGGAVYEQAMGLATSMLVTEIFDENPNVNLFQAFVGNVYFPMIDPAVWKEFGSTEQSYIAASKIPGYASVKRKGLRFRVRRFVRQGVHVAEAARLRSREVGSHLAVQKPAMEREPEAAQADLFSKG